MTNQIFDWQRFVIYTKAHWQENKRSYFWFFAVISMIYFLILLLILTEPRYQTDIQLLVYYGGLFITGTVFALRYFSALARTGSALVTLMQPVAVLEKWLLAMLTIVIAYPLVYTLIFEIMTYPMVEISRKYILSLYAESDLSRYQLFIPVSPLEDTRISILGQIPAWCIYWSLTSFALTGSIFFKRLPIIKTVALGFMIFLLFLFIAFVINMERFSKLDILFYWFMGEEYIATPLAWLASSLVWVIAPLLMWEASFFALKERDLA
ncbi:MAG: hypothetical protein KGV51_02645 [Moraxellaceae bacterium]|nr:hypothetical protein [Moraxellaceae bacterium]